MRRWAVFAVSRPLSVVKPNRVSGWTALLGISFPLIVVAVPDDFECDVYFFGVA